MTGFRVVVSRLVAVLMKRRRESDLRDEIQAHLDALAEEHLRGGMSLADARAAARRDFGGVDQTKEAFRDQRGLPFIDTLWQDLRYAARALRASPGFAAAAILSLALGIGANSAVFGVLNAALLRELPVREPDRLAAAYWRGPRGTRDFSYPIFRDLVARQSVFSDMAASGSWRVNRLKAEGEAEDESIADIDAANVSANYFSMLGVTAAIGRVFTPEDSRVAGEGAVVVLGDGFWNRRFGRDPSVLGRTLFVNDVPLTIIGVAPRGFFGDRVGAARDFWVPILMQPRLSPVNQLERRTSTWFRTLGRLKPGVSDEQAKSELTGLYRQLLAEENAAGSGTLIGRFNPADVRVDLDRGSRAINTGRVRYQQPLAILMGVVGLVLLIACCNVANLQLARGSARRREIGIRLGIGASRRRLVRQLMTESLLLAIAGGAAGLLVAEATREILTRTLSFGVLDLRSDSIVFAFTVVVSIVTTLVFGLLPAMHSTRLDVAPLLQTSATNAAGSAPRQPFTKGLIVVQVALTVWLLIGAGLLVRTLQNLRSHDLGFDRAHVMTVTPLLDARVTADVTALRRTLTERLRAIRGVESVGFSSGNSLFQNSMTTAPVRVPDSKVDPAGDRDVNEEWISPEYFRSVGMALVSGRGVEERDSPNAPRVAVINETMARHYFGSENAIGRTIYFPKVDAQNRYIPFAPNPAREDGTQIVGVVRDAQDMNLRQPPRKMAFLPLAQRQESAPVGFGSTAAVGVIHLRLSGDPAGVSPQLRPLLKQVQPGLSVRRISMLDDDIERTTMSRELMLTRMVGFFGLLALVLACVGLYGVMAYTVARRSGEIGIRMALGAKQTDVAGMVLREGAVLVVGGVALGVPAALATTRLIESFLFGVQPTDPATIGIVILILLIVAGAAGLLPATRAARVDPIVALRHQ